jgi:hypothetical protein
MINMLKRWRNINGVNIGIRSSTRDPFQGLIVQPSNLSSEEIGSIMRSGRKQMIDKLGAEVVNNAVLSSKEHIASVKSKRVRA